MNEDRRVRPQVLLLQPLKHLRFGRSRGRRSQTVGADCLTVCHPRDRANLTGTHCTKIGAYDRRFSSSSHSNTCERHRGTSLIRKRHPAGPYSRNMSRALWGSWGGGRFLMGEVPLHPCDCQTHPGVGHTLLLLPRNDLLGRAAARSARSGFHTLDVRVDGAGWKRTPVD